MPRPTVDDEHRRRREVAILLSEPESRAVRAAAAQRSMRVSAFARDATLAAAAALFPDGEDLPDPEPNPAAVALRREIRRLAANLNQLIRLAHQGRDPDLLPAVEKLRAAITMAIAAPDPPPDEARPSRPTGEPVETPTH